MGQILRDFGRIFRSNKSIGAGEIFDPEGSAQFRASPVRFDR
jgi:hypothetical protein